MATLEKIEKDIIRTKAKISEYQQKLRNLEAQKVEAENLQIVNLVKAVKLSTPQLTVLLSAYAKGDVLLPDEYEEELKAIEENEQQEDGTVLVEFEYFINGIQISRTRGGCGAEVKMEQSRITGLQLRMRGYSSTAETTALLPVTQAAAAVSALGEDGGEMVPCYQDTGEETLRAGWVVKK